MPATEAPEDQSAALHRFLAERGQDVLSREAPDGTLLYVSPAARRVLGHDPADLVGTRALDLVHPEDAAQARAERDAILASREARLSLRRVRRRDGSYVWLEVLAEAVRDPATGAVREVVSSARDVTARVLGEMAVAESERRFRATFEQAAVGVAHVGLDRRLLRVNPRFAEVAARPREALLGEDLLGLLHPDDAARLDAPGRLLAGEAEVQGEARLLRPGRAPVWVDLTLSLVRGDDGSPHYLLAVLVDITRRKASEQDLAAARRELAHMEKLSALGTLVSGVAHEVRTPLAYASNHLHWLQMRARQARERPLTGHELAQFERSVEEALEGLDRINRLVQDLRRFATRDRGQRAPAALHDLVRDAVGLFQSTHRGAHAVDARLGPAPPVLADRAQLQQVVLNLLENAADAMPGGGVVEVETGALDGHAVLRVTDHGPGIPPEAQGRIFDAFYSTKSHGMGLGLSIVKRIVDAHGGDIAFQTRPGEGTTFVVRFPLAAGPRPVAP
ncbi:MAG TPA: PAS domain S-box protein [Candidatus Thermoplasmatota archaeon]|nr:PAS domain S-box protein [Candidatus Thermoplasmatota archaeon]